MAETLLRPQKIESMTARLILAVGSRAGLNTMLQDGYYMIGRHEECQIRPKSRSVSRRHCLIFFQSGELHVRDLNSSSGTKVNAERVTEDQWVRLCNGDVLRCGKVVFEISIEPASKGDPAGGGQKVADSGANLGSGGLATSAPFASFDVASMLESEDEADRAERYNNIRRGNSAKDDRAGQDETELSDITETGLDLDGYTDAFDDEVSVPAPASEKPKSRTFQRSPGEENKARKNSSTKSTAKSRTANRPSAPTRKPPTKDRSRRRFSQGVSGDASRAKMMVAALLTVTVLGFFGYRVYQFAAGPPVRVIQNID